VIPENIHTTYHGQHLGIPRERGVSWSGILKAWGVIQFRIPNAWKGGSALDFQRGKMAKASLEIADLITFPVCKSSMNRLRDRSGRCYAMLAMGCAASSTSEEALKFMN